MSSSSPSSADRLQPSAELVDFAELQVRTAQNTGVERRSQRRNLIVVPVLIRPCNHEFRACGDLVAGMTRDISKRAIGLIHEENLEQHNLFAIQLDLADEHVNLMTEVVWCQPLGPYYFSACRFAQRLQSFPYGEPTD